eukprot:scaffold108557_cov41-Prasinocladus_malaysianus.AAC.1
MSLRPLTPDGCAAEMMRDAIEEDNYGRLHRGELEQGRALAARASSDTFGSICNCHYSPHIEKDKAYECRVPSRNKKNNLCHTCPLCMMAVPVSMDGCMRVGAGMLTSDLIFQEGSSEGVLLVPRSRQPETY